jgi:hypothetical protein
VRCRISRGLGRSDSCQAARRTRLPYATVVRPHRSSYAPAETSIRRGQRGGVVSVGGLVVVVAALVLGGCDQSASEQITARHSDAPAVPGPAPSHVDSLPANAIAAQQHAAAAQGPASPEPVTSSEEIVRAWFAALDAFVDAGHNDDWDSPGLSATAVQPELADEESELRWYAAAGLIAAGTPQIEGMQVDESTSSSATVTTCLGGIEFVKPSQRNSASIGSPPANDEELQVVVIDTSTGWKVRSERKVGSKCQSQ